jgi:hypothetical protein
MVTRRVASAFLIGFVLATAAGTASAESGKDRFVLHVTHLV